MVAQDVNRQGDNKHARSNDWAWNHETKPALKKLDAFTDCEAKGWQHEQMYEPPHQKERIGIR